MSVYLLVILTGFMGSFHCAVMCGPFVSYYSMGGAVRTRAHFAYQLGRLTAYLSLGALAGMLGRGFVFAGTAVGLQKGLMVAMGVLMILAGLSYYIPAKKSFKFTSRITAFMRNLLGQVSGTERAALLGLLTTLLPCGFLYAYALAALTTGHPLAGMATMGAFWLGTMPSLLGVGFASGWLSGRLPASFARLTPILLMILGILALTGKWTALPGSPVHDAFCFGPR